ncbi:MAG: TlpA family protein disulfide reductase [Bacteroidales bacterium]|nr:TlpA family protein disulfide reductase [Bacteroidales bacterium]
MKFKFIIVTVSALFGLLSCNSLTTKSDIEHKQTIVCGQIINQTSETSKVITIIECDPLDENDRYAVRLDSTGRFRAEFNMLWGHSFTINYDKNFINAYAEVGDSIYVEIDAVKFHEKNPEAIRFGGKNSEKNREFNQICTDMMCKIDYRSFTDFTLPLNDFMVIFEKEVKKINDSISIYCDKNNMSIWTQNMMKDMLLYSLSNYALDYKGQSEKDESGFYTQPIFDIYNNDKFSNMMFQYHLTAYFYRQILSDTLMISYIKSKDVIQAEKYGLKKIMAMPKCLSRDVMLFRLYSKLHVEKDNIKENIFYNKGVYNKVLTLYKQTQSDELPQITSGKGAFFITKKGEIENIADFSIEKLIREKYKGKVIYIDIWAVWCGSCRAEMAPARELHKLFHDEDVAFVNICMSSKQEAWISMIKNGEIEGDNYYFDDDLSAEASASMLSGGYPTYILIDKTSKIRNKKAPRPSALSEIGDEIEKLLSEK